MARLTQRTLICTFIALTSGVFGFWVGESLSISVNVQKCQTQPWGLRNVCEAWVRPRAAWQGRVTGLWTGMVLGGFIGGLATRKARQVAPVNVADGSALPDGVGTATLENAGIEVPLSPNLKLTPAQREVLQCLLILLAATSERKAQPSLPLSGGSTQVLSPELQRWAEVTARSHPLSSQNITPAQAKQLLVELGFSERAIVQAWRIVQVGK